jgi:Co/Zn/Cd efflux system component
VESDGDSRISDLHIWQVAAGRYAAIVSVVAREPKACSDYRDLFREHEELVHVTVEVQRCCEREEFADKE